MSDIEVSQDIHQWLADMLEWPDIEGFGLVGMGVASAQDAK